MRLLNEDRLPWILPQPGFPSLNASDKKFNSRLVVPTFFRNEPSARTSKGFLIVGTRVAARRSRSNRAASWSNVPDQLTQPLLALHDRRFKSCRQLQRQFTDPLHGRPTRIREILDRTSLGCPLDKPIVAYTIKLGSMKWEPSLCKRSLTRLPASALPFGCGC